MCQDALLRFSFEEGLPYMLRLSLLILRTVKQFVSQHQLYLPCIPYSSRLPFPSEFDHRIAHSPWQEFLPPLESTLVQISDLLPPKLDISIGADSMTEQPPLLSRCY